MTQGTETRSKNSVPVKHKESAASASASCSSSPSPSAGSVRLRSERSGGERAQSLTPTMDPRGGGSRQPAPNHPPFPSGASLFRRLFWLAAAVGCASKRLSPVMKPQTNPTPAFEHHDVCAAPPASCAGCLHRVPGIRPCMGPCTLRLIVGTFGVCLGGGVSVGAARAGTRRRRCCCRRCRCRRRGSATAGILPSCAAAAAPCTATLILLPHLTKKMKYRKIHRPLQVRARTRTRTRSSRSALCRSNTRPAHALFLTVSAAAAVVTSRAGTSIATTTIVALAVCLGLCPASSGFISARASSF